MPWYNSVSQNPFESPFSLWHPFPCPPPLPLLGIAGPTLHGVAFQTRLSLPFHVASLPLPPLPASQAIHSGLVVDKPAQELQNVLLAELDDISPDHAPAIVNAVLAPLLQASKRQSRLAVGRQRQPPENEMSEEAAASFLVVLDILPKVLLYIGVPAFLPCLCPPLLGSPEAWAAGGLGDACVALGGAVKVSAPLLCALYKRAMRSWCFHQHCILHSSF